MLDKAKIVMEYRARRSLYYQKIGRPTGGEMWMKFWSWVNGFPEPTTDARANDPGVPQSPQQVDCRGHADHERE